MNPPNQRLGIGLYGTNGHQLQRHLIDHPQARLVAIAGMTREQLPQVLRDDVTIRVHESLDAMLRDDSVQFVSLCSPRRADQVADAERCLLAGRHTYVEKPAAMNEADLDRLIALSRRQNVRFHEMAGTAFEHPYLASRAIVASGGIGRVVQVLAQKSYPMHERRPHDEAIDAGLLMQVGIHAVRMVEHVGQVRVSDAADAIQAMQMRWPEAGDLRGASTFQMRLANGGLATVIANYLNPPSFGKWGNEMLRVFGTEGFVEITDGGTRTRWLRHDGDRGPIAPAEPDLHYHDLIFASILGVGTMPLTLEEELHPTRVVIRARAKALDA